MRKTRLSVGLGVFVLIASSGSLLGSEGVIVENVAKSSAAEKAGLVAGDILLSWFQPARTDAGLGESRGRIRSIWDWLQLESDCLPRGPIKITGRRGGRTIVFDLPEAVRGISVAPVVVKDILDSYRAGRTSLGQGAVKEGIAAFDRAAQAAEKIGDHHVSTWLSLELGNILIRSRKRDEAQAAFQAIVDKASASELSYARAAGLYALGTAYLQKRDLEKAGESFSASASLFKEKFGETLSHAKSLHAVGVIFLEREDLERARDRTREALAIRERLAPWSADVAGSLNNLGIIMGDLGDWKGAAEYYGRALALWEKKDPGSLNHAQSLNNLGTIYDNQGDLDKAEDYYLQALAIREKAAPNGLDVAMSLNNLGVLAARRTQLEKARDYYERALAIREKLAPGGPDVASTLNNLGIVATMAGDLEKAEAYGKRSISIREKIAPASLSLAFALNNLGTVVMNRGDLRGAEDYFRKAYLLKEKLAPDHPTLAETLANLGIVAGLRGDFEASETFLRRSLEFKEKNQPGSIAVAEGLSNLSRDLYYRGDLETAEDLQRQALAILMKQAPRSIMSASALNHLGLIALERGDPETADGNFRRAQEILEEVAPKSGDLAIFLVNRGEVAVARRDFPAAAGFFDRALALKNEASPGSLDVALCLYHLGDLAEKTRDFAGAAGQYSRALAIQEKLAPKSLYEANTLYGLARVEAGRKRPVQAAEYYRRAVDSLEGQVKRMGGSQETKAEFRARYESLYKDYIDVLIQLRKKDEAFQVLERSRAQLFLALLAERDLAMRLDIPEDLDLEKKHSDREYVLAQEKLAGWTPDKGPEESERLAANLRRLREKRAELDSRIHQASPKYASLVYPRPLDAAGAKAALDPATVMLSYAVGQERCYLFVIAAAKPVRVHGLKTTGAALRADIASFLGLIQRGRTDPGSSGPLHRLGNKLYATLIAPAEKEIAKGRRVVIVPDGPLHGLPFAALVRSLEPKDRRYFIEWKPIHTVMSATVYAELRKKRDAAAKGAPAGERVLAAFGDPDYASAGGEGAAAAANSVVRSWSKRGFGFEPLTASRQEVTTIAKLFGAGSEVFLGDQATEEQAKALGRERRFIHFACHGLLDGDFPLNSGLALAIPPLAGEGRENGLLQAWEVFEQMRVEASLVVLSACQTGLGKEAGGEGLVGLTRAFFYAGAQSVIASLWEVADATTAGLMKAFYEALRSGLSKDEALREAELTLIRRPLLLDEGDVSPRIFDASHPFFWAAFTLFGDRL